MLCFASRKGKVKTNVRSYIHSTFRLKMKIFKKEETKRLSYSEAVTHNCTYCGQLSMYLIWGTLAVRIS